MKRDCPPRLYKYFAPDRVSFFSDLRVRYSQLGAFNDPFEGRPEITSLSNKEDILSVVNSALPVEIRQAYDQLPSHVQATITYSQVRELADHFAKAQESETLAMMQSIGVMAGSFFTGKIDQLLGVFCLSEVPDSLLMWAHYATSHTGFVVEFDAMHPSFHEQKSDEDDLRHIRRVYYRESRPSAPLSSMSAIELFLAKSGHWSYEREWRIVRPLADAVTTVAGHAYPIALFDVPPSAVTGVIMGSRMNEATAGALRSAVRANPSLAALRMRRAVADSSHFLLRFQDDN